MVKALVTGSAGFLGFKLAEQLATSKDNQVFCVDNFVRGSHDDAYEALIKRENVEHFDADLCSTVDVDCLPDVDVVYHMAALNGTQNFYERPFDVIRCSTLPTMNLLQRYVANNPIKRFIYAGTSEAYASTVSRFGWPVPTAEDVPLSVDNVFNPRWSYAASKIHGEIAVLNACSSFHVAFTIIRYHNVFGPRMGDRHIIPDFLKRCSLGVFELFGHADTRSFIYVDDAIRATIALANCIEAEREIVNVGSEDEIEILNLAKKMMEICGMGDSPISLHASPSGSVSRRCPSLNKLKTMIDFKPSFSLEEGISKTADYYYKPDASRK